MGNKKTLPTQQQQAPGKESVMSPKPVATRASHIGSGKLHEQVAIITGGDSGIGRAVAIAFAKEGCDSLIVFNQSHDDAKETKKLVEAEGRTCITYACDVGIEKNCQEVVAKTIQAFGKLTILVNNAAEQHPQKTIEDISAEQLEKTFRTNIFSYFYMTKAAMKYLKEGSSIINTTSVTAYKGSPQLLDYSATKGAIVAFTRSLSMNLAEKKIRVNGVAPGPIWTPLIPSTFDEKKVSEFGADVPMKRPGQPAEVALSYVFLASEDASYISGQVLHPNGGTVING